MEELEALWAAGETTGKLPTVKTDSIVIRNCHDLEELRTAVTLQKEVWNFTDAELVPLRLFVVAEKVGGQVIGAFDGPRMVGFALACPVCVASIATCIRTCWRCWVITGITVSGVASSCFQREEAMTRGFELIEWTFDPLEIKNAYLNIEKLGAIVRRYTINQYGITTSPLQGGLPTDRLIAEWWLKSKRVEKLLNGGTLPMIHPVMRISVPAPIYEWKASPETRDRAQDVQESKPRAVPASIRRGAGCSGLRTRSRRQRKFLLGPWDETWSTRANSLRYPKFFEYLTLGAQRSKG